MKNCCYCWLDYGQASVIGNSFFFAIEVHEFHTAKTNNTIPVFQERKFESPCPWLDVRLSMTMSWEFKSIPGRVDNDVPLIAAGAIVDEDNIAS